MEVTAGLKRQKKAQGAAALLRKLIPEPVGRQLLILLGGQLVSYFGARFLIRDRVHICMALPIDGRIPFLAWMIVIYFGCFAFWAVNYTLILRTERRGTYRFMRAELLGKLICFAFYVAVPTTLTRAEITGTGCFAALMRMLYTVDAPDCLFPSLHCFVSWMCVIGLRGKPEIPQWYRALSAVIAIVVFASTLTTKQHVIVDVISGVVLAELVWLVSGAIEKRKDGARS